jgi:ABC-type phosphate/phosphonate transport system substrate-binding protein
MGALVVATTISALVSGPPSELPGVLRLAVPEGAGNARTERALQPLRDYLAQSARRAIEVSVLPAEDLRQDQQHFDLALIPSTFLDSWGERASILARLRTHSMMGLPSRPYWLSRSDVDWKQLAAPRIVFGDDVTWSGGAGSTEYLHESGFDDLSRFGKVTYGKNPFDHEEAIAALVYGAYDVAIVREADLRRAVDRGFVDRASFTTGPAGEPRADFLLVADVGLSRPARDRLREAVLNLDLYRFDQPNYRVMAILGALEVLGLEGFAPYEVLPSLRR